MGRLPGGRDASGGAGERKSNRTYARGIALLIGVGFGSVIAVHFWPALRNWYADPVAAAAPPVVSERPATAASEPAESAVARLGTDSSASTVPLPLVLLATQPGRTAFEGTARLGTEARNGQTFIAGALLENGTRLAEIYSDRVVLSRDGRTATLYLNGTTATSQGRSSDAALLSVGGARSSEAVVLRSSAAVVGEYLNVSPLYRDGAVEGFRAFPGKDRSVFSAWGLRSGDVVTALNGSLPADAEQAGQVLSVLGEGGVVVASVRRATETLTVTLDGSRLVDRRQAQGGSQLALQTAPP